MYVCVFIDKFIECQLENLYPEPERNWYAQRAKTKWKITPWLMLLTDATLSELAESCVDVATPPFLTYIRKVTFTPKQFCSKICTNIFNLLSKSFLSKKKTTRKCF